MKKAPDKIYISQKNLDDNWNQQRCDDIEYIRKDALLEFLNGFDTNSNYERFVIDNLIEHIESL